MCIIISKDNWFIVEGETKPTIDCPKCGEGILGDAAPHGIRENGKVYNSVVCQNPNCNFHHYIQLEGWNGGEIKHK